MNMNMNIKAGLVLLCVAAALGVMWLAGSGDTSSDTVEMLGMFAALAAVIGFVALAEGLLKSRRE